MIEFYWLDLVLEIPLQSVIDSTGTAFFQPEIDEELIDMGDKRINPLVWEMSAGIWTGELGDSDYQ